MGNAKSTFETIGDYTPVGMAMNGFGGSDDNNTDPNLAHNLVAGSSDTSEKEDNSNTNPFFSSPFSALTSGNTFTNPIAPVVDFSGITDQLIEIKNTQSQFQDITKQSTDFLSNQTQASTNFLGTKIDNLDSKFNAINSIVDDGLMGVNTTLNTGFSNVNSNINALGGLTQFATLQTQFSILGLANDINDLENNIRGLGTDLANTGNNLSSGISGITDNLTTFAIIAGGVVIAVLIYQSQQDK